VALTQTPTETEKPALRAWLPDYCVLALAWGTSFVVVKVSVQSFTGVGSSLFRNFFGLLTLLVVLRVTGEKLPRGRVWGHIAVVACLLSVVPGTLVAISQGYISSSLAAILNSATPLVTLLVVMLAFRDEEVLTKERAFGLLLGFAGVLVVLGVWNGVGGGHWVGIVCVLVAVLGPSVAFPYTRRHLSGKVDAIPLATSQILVATIVMVPWALVAGTTHETPTWQAWAAVVCLCVVATALAYILNFRIIAVAGATTLASIAYVLPVVAVITGAIFLGERLSWYQPIGGAVVLLGAAISQGRLRSLSPWHGRI
jgi:drug/metabolite transporter (DMT)-like permease